MSRLILTLLGGFHAQVDADRTLGLSARKVQALVAYLACPAGRAHGRDKLAALLWSDVSDSQARTSLRQALAVLRRELGPVTDPLIRQDDDSLRLDPAAVDVDVAAFERDLSDGTPAALERAADRYRGDFLAGLRVTAPLFDAEPRGAARPEAAWCAGVAVETCVSLWRFWRYRCYLSEGWRWTTGALALDRQTGLASPVKLRANAYWGLSMFSAMLGRGDEALEQLEASRKLSESVDDQWGLANALTGLGWLANNRGDRASAVEMQSRAIELFRAVGDGFKLTYAYNSLGETLRAGQADERARPLFESSLPLCREIDNGRGVAVALTNLGAIDLATGRPDAARESFDAAVAIFQEIDDQINIATCLAGMAGALADASLATPVLGFVDQVLRSTGGQLQAADKRLFDREVARCRAELDPARFGMLWEQGGRLSRDRAIELARGAGAGTGPSDASRGGDDALP